MKILHLIYDHINNPWIGGGGAIRVHELYKRLSQKGHIITIVSGKYPHVKNYEEGNLTLHFVGIDNNYILSTFSYACYANKIIKKHIEKYDIVIEDFAPWNPVFSYKYNYKVPVVLQIQNYIGRELIKRYAIFGLPFYFIEKYYPLKFKQVIIVNDILRIRYKLPQSVFISNGIDDNLLMENITYNNGTYIGFIGRIDFYQKGLDILLSQNLGLYIKICGVGKRKDMKRLNECLSRNKYFVYLGYITGQNKVNFIKGAKFFVLPSRFEAQPLTILEAAALGRPLIVSDIAELRYVTDNGFGISFKSEDEKDLEQKIKYLWSNDKMVEEMGRKGREFAKNYTWDRIAEEYERFLITVKEGKHPS